MKTKSHDLITALTLFALSTLNPLPRRNRVKAGQWLALWPAHFALALALFSTLNPQLSTCFAQSSPRFTIIRSVIAGGGTTFSSSARFQLGGTIAQPLAAVPASTRFSIQGGFWIWPSPTFFAPAKVGTNFFVSFQTDPGNTYTVQYVNTLGNSNWQSLPSITGDGTVKSVTNTAPGVAQRFYRLLEQ